MLPQFEPNTAGMRRINRLGWVDGICFVSYGLRIGVRTNQPELLPHLGSLLPPGWRPARSTQVDYLYSLRAGDQTPTAHDRSEHFLYGNATRLARSSDLDDLLGRFESHLHLYVAEWARRRVFVHAGVVG